MTVLYVLFREVSDQYGTDEVVGVYSSSVLAAEMADVMIRDRRTFIKPVILDAEPKALNP